MASTAPQVECPSAELANEERVPTDPCEVGVSEGLDAYGTTVPYAGGGMLLRADVIVEVDSLAVAEHALADELGVAGGRTWQCPEHVVFWIPGLNFESALEAQRRLFVLFPSPSRWSSEIIGPTEAEDLASTFCASQADPSVCMTTLRGGAQ